MSSIDYAEVRKRCPTMVYLATMGWTVNGFDHAWSHGYCPRHGTPNGQSRSFHVHRITQCWHCHVCKVGGNVLDLAVWLKRLPLYEAAKDVCHTVGVDIPYVPRSAANRQSRRNRKRQP